MDARKTNARPTRNRLVAGCLLAVPLLFLGVAPAAADPPTEEVQPLDVFDDVNPCTGLIHTVTIATTFSVHDHQGTEVFTGDSVISTSTGFSGQGTASFTGNSQVERFHFIDMLTNDEGDRIQAKGIFVLDLSTDTVRVDRFDLVCVG
ncbi:hypothetical protein [Promicromonospora soli]|uniref:Dirigent-like protein n=1 Tax=Promicromonospora soli TaxID=2035533 RepID=A0A919FNH9_9MICO|nr:hypothetical protein [Promicromonospora soli]GHH69607.1 hypothetical protein GCM10017772_14830 [Promicromonospora soli]